MKSEISGSVSSCVSEQPMGSKETKLGAMNRINALEEQLKSHKRLPPRKKGIELTVLISFENGITLDEIPSGEGKDDEDAPEAYSDVPCAIVRVWKATSKEYVETCAWGTRIKVPTHLVETSKASNQTITGNQFAPYFLRLRCFALLRFCLHHPHSSIPPVVN